MIKAKYFDMDDIPLKVDWMNNPIINEQMFFTLPASVGATRNWFLKNINNEGRVDFTFKKEADIIGMGGFTGIDKVSNLAEFYVMVNPLMQGKGFGGKISIWMYNYAFLKLSLNKIYLFTNNDNVAAYKIYEKAGFKLEGLLREHKYKNGIYLDRRFYGLLYNDWLQATWKEENLKYEF